MVLVAPPAGRWQSSNSRKSNFFPMAAVGQTLEAALSAGRTEFKPWPDPAAEAYGESVLTHSLIIQPDHLGPDSSPQPHLMSCVSPTISQDPALCFPSLSSLACELGNHGQVCIFSKPQFAQLGKRDSNALLGVQGLGTGRRLQESREHALPGSSPRFNFQHYLVL